MSEYECSLRCSGNYDQICGDHWRNSVYDLGPSDDGDDGPSGSGETTESLSRHTNVYYSIKLEATYWGLKGPQAGF